MGKGFIQYVLANDNVSRTPIPKAEKARPVEVDDDINNGIRLVRADVVSQENRYHHDSVRLAQAVMDVYYTHDASRLPQLEPEPDQLVSAADK
jgi:squalene cyclase